MYWWYVQGCAGHIGAGKHREVSMYVYGKNVNNVMQKYKKMPSVKTGNRSPMPTITQLNDEEAKQLEQEITSEKKIYI